MKNNYETCDLPLTAAARRQLSAYYTPPELADTLARWAIRTGQERILEPACGDGALVGAALARGSLYTGPLKVCAVDLSLAATRSIASRFPGLESCITGSFLNQDAAKLGKFDVVLANPPFTRNHSLDTALRAELRRRFSVKGAAGLWLYFVLHSLSFLKQSGRIAFIVPRSAFFADYSSRLLTDLKESFDHVVLEEVEPRPAWVGGAAQERGALLLAEGFDRPRSVERRFAQPQLRTVFKRSIQSPIAGDAFTGVLEHTTPVGKVARISIGAVTGRNAFFLMSKDRLTQLGLRRRDVLPMLGKARHIIGPRISINDVWDLAEDGERTLLFAPVHMTSAVRSYVRAIDVEPAEVSWLARRNPWWRVEPGERPDAVITYMNHNGPRIALVEEGVYCTNTLHRLIFNPSCPEEIRRAAVMTCYSTFGQLAAELIGRSYGGGLLKFELYEASSLPILCPDGVIGDNHFKRFCEIATTGHEEAAAYVDELLLRNLLGRSWNSKVRAMRVEIARLRDDRRSRRSEKDDG